MSKWYEITVKSAKTYAVEMEDDSTEEDALDIACGEHGGGGYFLEAEITDRPESEEEIRDVIRHACELIPL